MNSVLAILLMIGLVNVARGLSFGSRCCSGSVARSLRTSTRLYDFTDSYGNGQQAPAGYLDSDRLQLSATGSTDYSFAGDLLVIPFYKPAEKDEAALVKCMKDLIPAGLDSEIAAMVGEMIDEGIFKGDASSKYVTKVFGGKVKNVALVGLGPNPKKGNGDMEVLSASRLGKSIATLSKDTKAANVGVAMPTGIANAGITQLFLGITEASYSDNRYKKVPEDGFKTHPLGKVTLLGCDENIAKDVGMTYRLTDMIGSGVNFAKDLVNAPPNSKTPIIIADLARKIASDHNIDCKVLNQKECEDLGMGAYLGVQQGSKYPPQFVHLTYKPEGVSGDIPKVALVGKGLTFDSGGYNLKAGPGSMIELMKFDMGGCAAVLGAAKAIAQLRPKNVEVHFITAVCENMVSKDAMRPGDILVASNGKTIEVLNTDAEGRLTLADALVYAEKLNPDTIIDLATLTGACIVGLGEKIAGLYANDDVLRTELEAAAKRSDEAVWAMPLHGDYKDMIKGTLGDIKNIGGKGAGSITAALFLQEFVEKDTRWAHIDMAGPVWDSAGGKPTGYGVKLLVDFLLNQQQQPKK